MSLKTFHLVFIGVSVMLAAFVAAWAGQQYMQVSAMRYAVTAVLAISSGVGLAWYGTVFLRKMRRLS
jgi:hypothetical protein